MYREGGITCPYLHGVWDVPDGHATIVQDGLAMRDQRCRTTVDRDQVLRASEGETILHGSDVQSRVGHSNSTVFVTGRVQTFETWIWWVEQKTVRHWGQGIGSYLPQLGIVLLRWVGTLRPKQPDLHCSPSSHAQTTQQACSPTCSRAKTLVRDGVVRVEH